MNLRSHRRCTDSDKVDGARLNVLPTNADSSATQVLAMDCEMVGVGPEGKRSALARVSIVNRWGNVVYDKYVRPAERVTDFRTQKSGVRPSDLRTDETAGPFKWVSSNETSVELKPSLSPPSLCLYSVSAGYRCIAEDFVTVQKEVADILKHRLLVGHALHHDFQVLSLRHPQKDIRDTQNYGPFLKSDGRSPALKYLADLHLGTQIQQGEHDSVEDARTALRLYLLFQKAWEKTLSKVRQRGLESARKPYYSKKASRVG